LNPITLRIDVLLAALLSSDCWIRRDVLDALVGTMTPTISHRDDSDS
jgi:hypothetical protein